ncbi:hypothetical protein NDU88_005201 [Pleurodeles waltl]|uniref:Uncharacterized protein n=1 Tax=Pleurodeles waltl TaxID=8319 RepID=A0AAV7L6U7_PLEWA|nr:hypothetical protein NDU88_005201 [Pleurodeles waltl]
MPDATPRYASLRSKNGRRVADGGGRQPRLLMRQIAAPSRGLSSRLAAGKEIPRNPQRLQGKRLSCGTKRDHKRSKLEPLGPTSSGVAEALGDPWERHGAEGAGVQYAGAGPFFFSGTRRVEGRKEELVTSPGHRR